MWFGAPRVIADFFTVAGCPKSLRFGHPCHIRRDGSPAPTKSAVQLIVYKSVEACRKFVGENDRNPTLGTLAGRDLILLIGTTISTASVESLHPMKPRLHLYPPGCPLPNDRERSWTVAEVDANAKVKKRLRGLPSLQTMLLHYHLKSRAISVISAAYHQPTSASVEVSVSATF